MRIFLLALLVLSSPSIRADDKKAPGKTLDLTIRLKASRTSKKANADRIDKIRRRLTVIEEKNSGAKLQDETVAIGKSLDAADAALSSQVSDSEAERVPTPNAEPAQKAASQPKPSPRPDPKTLPHDCPSIECKASEGAAKGGLGTLRSGASIFYGDFEGVYPADLSKLIPKYVDAIPALEVGGHPRTNAVRVVTQADGKSPGAYVEDTGGWLYFRTPGNPDLDGQIVIDCNHADYKGRPFWGF